MASKALLVTLSNELSALIEGVLPSVVALTSTTPDGGVAGSGFVYDAAGHVVTNHHVVDGVGPTMQAAVHQQPTQTAKVLGSDPLTDLAVLELETPVPHHLVLRREAAKLGELCVALGSPLGIYPESASLGIVSGLARSIPQPTGRPIERAIQTDCAINPGNSGGPLVDAEGTVLGVNMCIDTRGAGIGFSIPADTVGRVIDELIAHGSVERASLGVSVANRQIELDGQQVMRLVVTQVGAAKTTLKVGDAILQLAGEVIDERADLFDSLGRDRIGTKVDVQVLRDGKVKDIKLTPGALGT